MAGQRILLLQCPPDHEDGLPASLHRHFPELSADIAQYVTQALDRLKIKGYQAVVCWADERDELAAIIRIRKTDAKIPVFVVSRRSDDAKFSALAAKIGATSVCRDPGDADLLAESIATALRNTVSLSNQLKSKAGTANGLSKEVREIVGKTGQLTDRARLMVRAGYSRFDPLLVVDRKVEIASLKKALSKLQMPWRLPILKRGEEVIAYLEAEPPFNDRHRYPPPSIIILDQGHEGLSSHETLSWIRKHPQFKSLPVAMLSDATDQAEKERQATLGVTWRYPRGRTPADLTETLKKISLNWTLYNMGLDV